MLSSDNWFEKQKNATDYDPTKTQYEQEVKPLIDEFLRSNQNSTCVNFENTFNPATDIKIIYSGDRAKAEEIFKNLSLTENERVKWNIYMCDYQEYYKEPVAPVDILFKKITSCVDDNPAEARKLLDEVEQMNNSPLMAQYWAERNFLCEKYPIKTFVFIAPRSVDGVSRALLLEPQKYKIEADIPHDHGYGNIKINTWRKYSD